MSLHGAGPWPASSQWHVGSRSRSRSVRSLPIFLCLYHHRYDLCGLLAGLSLGGGSLTVAGPSPPDELGYDVIATSIAVAAYGTFFSMPWRTLPIPILMEMIAHASRLVMMSAAGASFETGAFVACLIVGIFATPIVVCLGR
jgi:hypothetical protein